MQVNRKFVMNLFESLFAIHHNSIGHNFPRNKALFSKSANSLMIGKQIVSFLNILSTHHLLNVLFQDKLAVNKLQ